MEKALSAYNTYNPGNQVVLLLISLFLLLLYIVKPFKNEKYNNLCLAFAVFNFSWLATIVARYLYLEYGGKPIDSKGTFIEVPYAIKCYFGEENCQKGNIEVFTLIHFIGYTIIGLLIPGLYWEILIISVACELLELAMGITSKFFLDPAVNMLGYVLGSALSWNE